MARERGSSEWNGLMTGLGVWAENPELERRVLGGWKDRGDQSAAPGEEGRQSHWTFPWSGWGARGGQLPPLQENRTRTTMGSARAAVRPQKCPGGLRCEPEGLQRQVSYTASVRQ